MKISDVTGWEKTTETLATSPMFKLGDGHHYTIWRHEKEGKRRYTLFGASGGAVTPAITEEGMDVILARRDSIPPIAGPDGFTCPGCGAKVSKDGVHLNPPKPPTPEPAPTPAPDAGGKSRYLK